MIKKTYYLCILAIILFSCNTDYQEKIVDLDSYKVQDSFKLQVVASEPLLVAPVAMDFDNEGRIWVAEMPSYMENLEGKGENDPIGKIKILEDLDHDGVMDHTKIFLDSLVLPRALALVYDGLLYAEPPYLFYVEIKDDKPYNKIVVDSLYAAEGNPEHQPNGLRMNVDNWIYSAKSSFRYRRKNGKWLKEPTTFRGQWGIAQDNFGRLYYNDNSRQLLGDYVLPNRFIRNQFLSPKHGVDRQLTKNQRVYPLHPTLVNRGYAEGVLDRDSLLVEVTAACGPLVYRGGSFPGNYKENVFVCVPEANLIKRNILEFFGDSTSARQAWEGKEFIASTDSGFRPVNLNNGPDGALYIVDMHRGIIGHHAYLSPYYKKAVKATHIDTLIHFGRILKVNALGENPGKIPNLNTLSNKELLHLLDDDNGWLRDRAQQLLITKADDQTITMLQELAKDTAKPLGQLHALYTLEDKNGLSFELLIGIAKNGNADIASHAVVLLESFIDREKSDLALELFEHLVQREEPSINLYINSTLGKWAAVSKEKFAPLLLELAAQYKNRPIQLESILSGLEMDSDVPGIFAIQENVLTGEVGKLEQLKLEGTKNEIYTNTYPQEDNRTKGAKIFRQICAACHGINGTGTDGLAPPLIKSEFVKKPLERLGLIVLHGLTGPIHVDGKLYTFNQAMPGLIANESLTDQDISDVISYVSNAFSDVPSYLSAEKIRELRGKTPKDGVEYTEQELLEAIK